MWSAFVNSTTVVLRMVGEQWQYSTDRPCTVQMYTQKSPFHSVGSCCTVPLHMIVQVRISSVQGAYIPLQEGTQVPATD